MESPIELPNESNNSDTKDFAEHLRSVHFTLGLVCLGLLVIVTQPTRSELRSAYDQARDITELSRHWNTKLIQNAAVSEVANFRKQEQFFGVGIDNVRGAPRAVEIKGKRYNVTFGGPNWGFLPNSARDNMIQVGDFDGAALELNPPTNLSQFRKLWDVLAEDKLTAWGSGGLAPYVCLSEGSTYGGDTERWYPWKAVDPSSTYPMLSFTLGRSRVTDDAGVPQTLRGHFDHVFRSEGGAPQFNIPVVSEVPVAIIDGQTLFIDAVQGRWRHGPYDLAFEELNAVTRNYEDVDLGTIQRIVQSELERSKDVFQAFGISFPVETTGSWGVLLILAVQIYLLFHLAEFRRRNMHNVTIAWIGLYGEWGPRLLFIVSSFIFPLAVIYYVAPQIRFLQSAHWIPAWFMSSAVFASSLAVAALSASEYRKVQRARTAGNAPQMMNRLAQETSGEYTPVSPASGRPTQGSPLNGQLNGEDQSQESNPGE